MNRRKVIALSLTMAFSAGLLLTSHTTVEARGHRHCHHRHNTTVEQNVDEQTDASSDETTASILEKLKGYTAFEEVTNVDDQQFLLLVETKTGGINLYQEKDIIETEKIDAKELADGDTYYDTRIKNPEDMELIYSSDGNEDISAVHMGGEFGAFQCVGDRLKDARYEGLSFDESITQGPELDQNKQYVNFLYTDFINGALRGNIESTTSATEVFYETGDMFQGGGYDYYAEYGENDGTDAEYTLVYDIVINDDKTINFTIGAYNEENDFAADVTYHLIAEDGGAYSVLN
ncbi:hypothetical protein [Pseudobutyrivibrio sp.]|uniref:hypothetical protein n=1 Tax=Pseudobutyrivibrio sp. TaxID=2014367 RepID=UPI0025E65555|nr:hypothetical protein [Pseudobutyrivibrio sp.]MBR5649583.1 hypothetical protein [Pseudobutyrivibrio sp.]